MGAAGFATLVVLLLGACAGGPGEPGPSPRPPEAPPTTPSQTLSPQPVLPTGPPGPVTPPGRTPPIVDETQLTGDLIEGVEAGCIVLQTDRGDYLLLGEATRDLPIGATVTVRGQERTDLSTICQQGTPFEVTEVLD